MNINLRQLAEIAALVSAKSTLLIESSTPISDEDLQSYWQCTRDRTVDWIRHLDEVRSTINSSSESEHAAIWVSLKPVLSEVFVTEILTRVWGATLTAIDRHRNLRRAAPIASHTTNGHRDARGRAMRLLVNGPQVPINELAQIDRIRRKAERWTDLLVGHLALKYELDQFAFESRRALEFGQSQMRQILEANDTPVWELVLAGVRLGFSSLKSIQPLSDYWNRGIVEAIIGTFPPDCFDTNGMFQSVLINRAERSGLSPERAPAASKVIAEIPLTSRLQFAKLKQRFEQQ